MKALNWKGSIFEGPGLAYFLDQHTERFRPDSNREVEGAKLERLYFEGTGLAYFLDQHTERWPSG